MSGQEVRTIAGTAADRFRSCPLCGRDCPHAIFESHHLRTRRNDKGLVEAICRECHKTIHGMFSNTELRDPRRNLDSVEGLLESPKLQRALSFIRKVPPGSSMRMRESSSRRRRR